MIKRIHDKQLQQFCVSLAHGHHIIQPFAQAFKEIVFIPAVSVTGHQASQHVNIRVCSCIQDAALIQHAAEASLQSLQANIPAFPCMMASCPLQSGQVSAAAGPAVHNALSAQQTLLNLAAT